MEKETLALLGGKPIQSSPFPLYNTIGEEEKQAVVNVMERRVVSDFLGSAGPKFLGGEFVQKFEREFCDYFKVKYAISFNSATTALQAAVAALGIGPGDEVITTPFSMTASPSSILLNGAVPVFADIDEETLCLDVNEVEKSITERTKGIMVITLFGTSPDYDALVALAKKHNLKIIEDNAQGIGGTYKGKYLGTIGDIGVFSFNVHKQIQSGEGGVLVTNDDDIAYRAQLVRNHGEAVIDKLYDETGHYEALAGSNYRLSELHAAIASEQLKKLNRLLTHRIELCDYLSRGLSEFSWLTPPKTVPMNKHVYYAYAFKFNREKVGFSRGTFIKAMTAEGFPLFPGYVKPLYLMQLYQKKQIYPNSRFPFVYEGKENPVRYHKGLCPVTERLHEEELIILNLCFNYPESKEDLNGFIEAVKKIERHQEELVSYENKN